MLRRPATHCCLLLLLAGALAAPGTASAQAPVDDGADVSLDLDLNGIHDLADPGDGSAAGDEAGGEDDPGDDDGAAIGDGTGDSMLDEELSPMPLSTLAVVPGRTAAVRPDGRAAIPRGAPKRVRAVIRAANRIVGRPYRWGGGHGARLADRGYDCSGAVSFALIKAGLQRRVMVSGGLAKAFRSGAGRWVTVYATRKHVYMEVAGLRLDTSPFGDPAGRSGVRWRPVIGARRNFHVRHPMGV